MPELPDVQVFKEYVDATSLRRPISGVHADAGGLRESVPTRTLRRRLAGRRGTIKGTLMNQEVLAGLGNEYTDEILFQARLHPETATDELSEEEVERLHRCTRDVVAAAVEARVGPDRMPEVFLLRHRAEGEPCPRCGRPIEKTEVAGRPTYLCPHEQTLG